MPRIFLLLIAAAVCAGLPIADGHADIGGEPPIVTIYDSAFSDVEELAVNADETFILYGVAVGEVPLFYYWLLSGEIIESGNVLEIAIAEPGVFVIVCEVIDVNTLSGTDSVVVTVSDGPVANESATWSAVKALYE